MTSGGAGVLNIDKEELSKVSLLILQSIFLGVFAGAFDVGAQSVFLDVYDASLIPKAFAVSGATGIIITSVYSFLQSRIRFSVFALLNLLFVVFSTLALRLGFKVSGDERLVFAMFVLMGPLTIITFLGFWGTVSRLFTLRQGKRLFGMIDTGQIAGMIISFYAIPVILRFNFRILDSLYLCAASIFLALVMQVIISVKFRFARPVKSKDLPDKVKSNFFSLFRTRYTRLIVFFVALSVFVAFFIHYSFLSVTEENYSDPKGLASFLGVFMGTLMLFTLIVKTLIYGRLMKTYGIKIALLISPVILGVFTILTLFVANRYGFAAGSAGFTLFFLLVVSAKLFSKSLKDSIEVPSSKILYQALDSRIRYDVQARIDGTINELAAFSAGLLMAGLALTNFTLVNFSWVLAGIIILWLITGVALYKAYRTSLQESLRKYLETEVDENQKNSVANSSPDSIDEDDRLAKILTYVPQSWNGFISGNLEQLLKSGHTEIRKITIQWINQLNLTESEKFLVDQEMDLDNTERKHVQKLITRFELPARDLDHEHITRLIRSEDPEDRLKAVAAIMKAPDFVTPASILPLFRDPDIRVKASGIRAAGKLKFYELAGHLIDMLSEQESYPFAYGALREMGADILDKLEQGFYRTGISAKTMIRLIRLIRDSSHPDAGKTLMNMMETTGIKIQAEILNALLKLSYVPDEHNQIQLMHILHEVCSIAAWNYAARFSVRENKLHQDLFRAFDAELKSNFDFIFNILSIIYDAQLIYHIRKNLESGTTEGIGFAIELLDMFVEESIKSYLFPLIEDRKETSRLHRLQSEFPVAVYKSEELVNKILNRDCNKINSFTKLLAIETIDMIEGYVPANDLVAQLFNPNEELANAAAEKVISIQFGTFEKVSERLSNTRYENVMEYMANKQAGKIHGLYQRFRVLEEESVFGFMNFRSLARLASDFTVFHLHSGEDLSSTKFDDDDYLIFLFKGHLSADLRYSNITIEEGAFFRKKDFDEHFGKKSGLTAGNDAVLFMIREADLKERIFDDEFEYIHILDIIEDIKEIAQTSKEGMDK